jgi:8-oxo-dGTP diphosphatase
MSLYLVRHAKAGSRSNWDGDDRKRPLTAAGWEQARAVAERLAPLLVTRLVSSPYVRCIETLEPIATRTDLDIEVDDRLAEETPFEPVLDLLHSCADGAVLCSHGDIIPEVIAALQRRGMVVRGEPDWRKATVWVLDRDAVGDVVEACVWPPPRSARRLGQRS